jgi:hypothetical protein
MTTTHLGSALPGLLLHRLALLRGFGQVEPHGVQALLQFIGARALRLHQPLLRVQLRTQLFRARALKGHQVLLVLQAPLDVVAEVLPELLRSVAVLLGQLLEPRHLAHALLRLVLQPRHGDAAARQVLLGD